MATTKVKYYIGQLYERNGEYEYYHTMKFKLGSRFSPLKYMKELAKHWYADYNAEREKGPEGGWLFHGGAVFVEEREFKEISESTYNELGDLV
jgi:hypothetical protein